MRKHCLHKLACERRGGYGLTYRPWDKPLGFPLGRLRPQHYSYHCRQIIDSTLSVSRGWRWIGLNCTTTIRNALPSLFPCAINLVYGHFELSHSLDSLSRYWPTRFLHCMRKQASSGPQAIWIPGPTNSYLQMYYKLHHNIFNGLIIESQPYALKHAAHKWNNLKISAKWLDHWCLCIISGVLL